LVNQLVITFLFVAVENDPLNV